MSTVVVATVKSNSSSPPAFQNTSGTEIGRLCRAFVNFDGTGTVTIRAQYNVSSITDNGVGDYTVNFTTALADANYAISATAGDSGVLTSLIGSAPSNGTPTTSAFRFYVNNSSLAAADRNWISVAIFR